MSFKKTVTFSASVSDYTDGTVTARVQAENNILGQFVTWLLAQNTSISQIEKVEIGDSRWSGYPMYAVQNSVPSTVTNTVNKFNLLSDVYMLGKNKNNFLLGICVDDHVLTVSPTCSFEYQDYLNDYSSKPLSIIMEQLRRIVKDTIRKDIGCLDLYVFNTNDTEISMTLNYWKGADTLIIQSIGSTSRLFFSFDAIDSSFGWLGLSTKLLANYSFNELIQASTETQTLSSSTSDDPLGCLSKGYCTNANPFYWGNMYSYTSGCYYQTTHIPTAIRMHLMNKDNPAESILSVASYVDNFMGLDASTTRIICNTTLFNFPRITTEQLYLRKMYIPNCQTASPIKLGYTPGNLYADAIYKVNNKYYLCLKNGWCSYFIEVVDQG